MTYTFGSVRVDADIRSIVGPAGEVRLTRKAWELLVLLLERRPNAVSKAEIHARVWPETFVSESSVQSLVHEIRRAIDLGAAQSWIRTVHGIGYRFCGPVAATGPAAAERVPAPLRVADRRVHARRAARRREHRRARQRRRRRD